MSKRFIHISDLHIGITLCGADLMDDIRHILIDEIAGRIIDEASKDKPVDGLIIAGDVFDRGSTSAEAEALFGEFLTKVSIKKKVKVFCTSGNHDSSLRIAAHHGFLQLGGVYISQPFSGETPYRIESFDDVDVVMLPYISMVDVKSAFEETKDTVRNTQQAVRYVLDKVWEDPAAKARPHILVAHQAVGASVGKEAGSQQIISPSVFSDFTYTALGHFHSAGNPAGVENVRYCGSPLCYSLNEAKRNLESEECSRETPNGGKISVSVTEKTVDIIDVDDDGNVTVSQTALVPLHRVVTVRGAYSDIMSYFSTRETDKDYYYFLLTSEDIPEGMNALLRDKFPLMLSVRLDESLRSRKKEKQLGGEIRLNSFREDFARFFEQRTGEAPDDDVLSAADFIFELTKEASNNGSLAQLKAGAPILSEEEKVKVKADAAAKNKGGSK